MKKDVMNSALLASIVALCAIPSYNEWTDKYLFDRKHCCCLYFHSQGVIRFSNVVR